MEIKIYRSKYVFVFDKTTYQKFGEKLSNM